MASFAMSVCGPERAVILSGKCLAAQLKKSILPAGRMTDDG
jgi:hypothetical protein